MTMRIRSIISIALAGVFMHAAIARAQAPAPLATDLLITEIGERSQVMLNLEELCDDIGPRLTGSPQLRTAQAWAMDKLKKYGAVNVHEQAWELGRPWRRGPAFARLRNANVQHLDIVQKAWTEGTAGKVRADLAILNVKTWDQFQLAAPALRGKIVLIQSAPRASEEQRKNLSAYVSQANRTVRAAGFAAVLLVSEKGNHLLSMWGGPDSLFDRHAGIISRSDASFLKRLLARGVTPRLELVLGGQFAKYPVQAYNVVADFVGSEKPDEVVIVGAHQDSWDLGTGATDNGTGTVVAMETLRAIVASGLKPKRTLRVVLFSGEEQGLLGSKAYLARNRDQLAQIQAVLVQDTGSGRILGFPDMKVEAWYAALRAALAPAQQLGPLDVVYAAGGGSDHEVFFDQGIPAFVAMQELLDYRSHTQDSNADTLEHAVKADLVQAAQVMAVTAWGLLNGERLPHLPHLPSLPAQPLAGKP